MKESTTDRALAGKVALIHGAGGAIGAAIARAFARQGARLFLAGRTRAKLDGVARDAAAYADAPVETAEVDALDERAVDAHTDAVVARAGRLDIAVNAVGIAHVQGVLLADLAIDDFAYPIAAYTRTNFLTARAAARPMVAAGRGVILMLSTPGSRMTGTGFLGYGVTCAAIEALTRLLAAELGPRGVRVNCVQSHAIPQAVAAGSHAGQVFRKVAESQGTTVEAMLEAAAASGTLLKRLPTLAEVAGAAVFLASDLAGAMTGTIANLTCGALVD